MLVPWAFLSRTPFIAYHFLAFSNLQTLNNQSLYVSLYYVECKYLICGLADANTQTEGAPRLIQGLESDMTKARSRLLPQLSGSKRAVRLAYRIRDLVRLDRPDAVELLQETEATFWIQNKARLIGEVSIPKTLPGLVGGSPKMQAKAFAIRANIQSVFPELALLRSQTEAEWWVRNRVIFDFAIHGYEHARSESAEIKG